jgi:KEOPS complex subunit Pcc1
MTLNFDAQIIVDAKEKNTAIFDSINIDNKFYPENPTKTEMHLSNTNKTQRQEIIIDISSDQLPHLRANLNSTLRLIQASFDSISSVHP